MTKSALTYIFALFILCAAITACNKEYPGIEELDTQAVNDYIQKNNLSVQQYGQTGIYYQVVKAGTGPDLTYSEKIPLIYTVKTLDGSFTSMDTFVNRYYNYFGYYKPDSLREVMKYSGVKQGGAVRIILPSRYAFGKNGSGSIPGNSSLDYTVTAITADKLAEYEDHIINQYILANNLSGFAKTASGLYYKITSPGEGAEVISNSSLLTLEYTGKLFNGTIFDKTAAGASASFVLGSLIEGWKEGLPFIKKGGSISLIIPSSLAYGKNGSGNSIPPFSCLYFDIKVTNVTN